MQTIKLTIAYDGSGFHGWQLQPGLPTIQGALQDALRQITQEPITIQGASRTDAGVHAQGQVAHFKTRSTLDPHEIQRGMNALLPPTIRIVAAQEVGQDFHARWLAQGKTYRYRIYRGEVLPPFDHRRAFHYPWPLDEAAMSAAARAFAGQHDFTSFAASTGSEEDDKDRDMLRKIVGTLIEVGRGRLAPTDIPEIFAARDRSRSGPTVPPEGLYLVALEYPDPTDSLAMHAARRRERTT
jgi:tRNA pseudouridine38-40 synthase